MDTFEEEELIDIDEVRTNIANIDAELKEVQAQMDIYLNVTTIPRCYAPGSIRGR